MRWNRELGDVTDQVKIPLGQTQRGKVIDQDHQYKIALKIEGKADRTAEGYKFICPIFRLDKTSLHHGLRKLSEQHCLVGGLWWVMLVIKALTKKTPFSHPRPYASLLFIGF